MDHFDHDTSVKGAIIHNHTKTKKLKKQSCNDTLIHVSLLKEPFARIL